MSIDDVYTSYTGSTTAVELITVIQPLLDIIVVVTGGTAQSSSLPTRQGVTMNTAMFAFIWLRIIISVIVRAGRVISTAAPLAGSARPHATEIGVEPTSCTCAPFFLYCNGRIIGVAVVWNERHLPGTVSCQLSS